jgi:hypothetical protein
LEVDLLAQHARSYVPAVAGLDPAHARQLRLHREAKGRLSGSDVVVPAVDCSVYDRVVGLS